MAFVAVQIGAAVHAETWLKAETPRFVLYSDGEEQTLREYGERLELLDATFWEVFGLQRPPPPPRKLPIYLTKNMADLQVVLPNLFSGAAGFYLATDNDTVAMGLARKGNDYVLLHEYTHHLMLQNFPSNYPAWFVEGYAEYFMGTTVDESRIKVGLANDRINELQNGAWLSTDEVLSKRPSEIPEGLRGRYYAEAWLLTHYLISDPERSKQLTAYLEAIGRGEPSASAMQKASGLDANGWQRRLSTYVEGRLPYFEYKKTQFPKPSVQISHLSPAASALLIDDLRIRLGTVAKDAAPAVLANARTTAAKYPDDSFAQLALARAETSYGDKEAAGVILKKRLAANPHDVEALAAEADRLMAMGDADAAHPANRAALYNQAGAILVTAYQLDQSRYQTLAAFAESRRFEPGYPSENTLTALLTALKAAPQVGSLRLRLAHGFILRGKTREAIVVLTPLANSPHDSADAKRAREMLGGLTASTPARP